jgi:hypothetical protein
MEEPRVQRPQGAPRLGGKVNPMAHPASWIIPAYLTLAAASLAPQEFKEAADVFSGFIATMFCSVGAVLSLRIKGL